MKRNKRPLSPAKRAKRLGISKEQFEAEVKKQADEFFRKKGLLAPEMTPDEKAALEKQAKAAAETFEKNFPHNPDWSPFPLSDIDINDSDNPHLIEEALKAIIILRISYMPDSSFFGEQYKYAIEIASKVRWAWSSYGVELEEVPLAKNLNWPTERDFIELQQWFISAQIRVRAHIAAKEGETKPNDLITLTVAAKKYIVSKTTLRRAISDTRLKNYNRETKSKNSPVMVSESEVGKHWLKR